MPIRKKRRPFNIANRADRIQHLYKIRSQTKELVHIRLRDYPLQLKMFLYALSLGFRGIRAIIEKGRKAGVSTFWLVFYLDDTLFTENTNTGIIAHRKQDVQKLFRIVKLAYKTCPDQIELPDGTIWYKPIATTDNKNELRFEKINSSIYVDIESRGDTNNNLHISEAAHIENEERIIATLGSVPVITDGSNVTAESTANGPSGWFYDQVMAAIAGESNFKLFFFPWYEVAKNTLPSGDWQPGEAELKIKNNVKARFGVELTNDQLFWWHRTKRDFKRLMDQEHPTFIEDAFLMAGNLAFDLDYLALIKTMDPIEVVPFKVRKTIIDDTGAEVVASEGVAVYDLKVFVQPNPSRKYVLGGDPAEGVGGDSSVIEVYDRLTLEQVAEFTSDKIKPKEFARLVDKVARYYNNALAVIESNNHGYAVLDELKTLYTNIYKRQVFDEKTKSESKKLGFKTDAHTRDLILDELEELLMDCCVKINSATLQKELFTFIVNEDGKRIAKSGQHDDTIMASAIALKIARLPVSTFFAKPVP